VFNHVARPATCAPYTRKSAPVFSGRRQRVAGLLVLPAAISVLLSGCAGASGQTAASTAGASSTTQASATGGDVQSAAKILKAGFGQRDQYAWVTSIVQAVGTEAVGKFVTVQFNLLDASGEILNSTEQVEAFSFPGQTLALGTQVDLSSSNTKAAKVEATLVLGDNAGQASDEFPVTATPTKIGKNDYSDTVATFQLVNAGAAPVRNARVGVVCLNKAGEIIGGTSEYPDVIPAKGRIRVDAAVITTTVPATCEVYPGPGF
jgi:hypothetical protein